MLYNVRFMKKKIQTKQSEDEDEGEVSRKR